MTPIEQAIAEVKRQCNKRMELGLPADAYWHCEAILQSLLLVEQQMIQKAYSDGMREGDIDDVFTNSERDNEGLMYYNQLFTNQNEGK